MREIENKYSSIIIDTIFNEIDKTQEAGALIATATLIYSFIDSMAWLAMEEGREEVKQTDFAKWIDKYMVSEENQEFVYSGEDIKNARNGLIHTLSPQIYRKNLKKQFIVVGGYTDAGPHRYRPDLGEVGKYAYLSIPQLTFDFKKAVGRFFQDVLTDKNLKKRVDGRIIHMFMSTEINKVQRYYFLPIWNASAKFSLFQV